LPQRNFQTEACDAHIQPACILLRVADFRLSDSFLSDRRDALLVLRKGLLEHPRRIALVGHSLGGYAVLALAGARP
jgi:hypothetical protein